MLSRDEVQRRMSERARFHHYDNPELVERINRIVRQDTKINELIWTHPEIAIDIAVLYDTATGYTPSFERAPGTCFDQAFLNDLRVSWEGDNRDSETLQDNRDSETLQDNSGVAG